ncbi:MAG TPA: hypothetical protein VI386_33705 [Candidatus Sulfotelmatobacter sp.]
MQQLPKIARGRLQAMPPLEHPDADLLTAFAEQSLLVRERAAVMDHLSHCGDCREVLALALPEMEQAAAPAVLVHRPWFSMPMLRWGAIAAAVLVVASVGVVRYQQHVANQITTAKLETLKAPVREASPPPSPSSGGNEARAANSPANPSRRRIDGATAMARSATAIRQPAVASFASAQAAAKSSARGLSSPTQTQTVEMQSAPAAASMQPAEAAAQSNSVSDQSVYEDGAVVGKAKPPMPQAAMGSLSEKSLAGLKMAMAVPAMGPRWSITAAGKLQRSVDEGKTWQDVNLTSTSAGRVLQAGGDVQLKQKTASRDEAKDLVAVPVIRAIAASGSEIWAGASGGLLYHSVDGGNLWTTSIPSQGDILLSGDIVSVQFSDALHGRVATSTSEVWTTADGGLHWGKQ